jgi:DNA-binding MarR family transcriptional regulator
MSDVHLSPTEQKVLQILREHHDLAYTPTDISELMDSTPQLAQAALEALANHGLIERQKSAAGVTTAYIARQ